MCACVCVCVLSPSITSDSCVPMDCSPPGSSAHGIFQARLLEWVAISFSRGSSQPRDQTRSLASPTLAQTHARTFLLKPLTTLSHEDSEAKSKEVTWLSNQAIQLFRPNPSTLDSRLCS